jgi:hypothetical protein
MRDNHRLVCSKFTFRIGTDVLEVENADTTIDTHGARDAGSGPGGGKSK